MTDSDAHSHVQHEMPVRVGFLLIDDFAMLSYAAVAEPFRAANVLAGAKLYRWDHIGSSASIEASSGARLSTRLFTQGDRYDLIFVFAGGNPSLIDEPELLAWLRLQALHGARLAGVSGGPWLLARAGLLDGYRCTIHWEHRPAFCEAFPLLDVQQSLFVIDRDRLTCAGGTAGLDMAVELVRSAHGPVLAAQVSEWHIRTHAREAGSGQRLSIGERYGTTDERLLAVLQKLEDYPEEPLDRAALARSVGLSTRQLERLFATRLGSSVTAEQRAIRLARAMRLLRETEMSATEVAIACGFVSPAHFSRIFSAKYGFSPTAARQISLRMLLGLSRR